MVSHGNRSTNEEMIYAERVIKAGGRGFLPKQEGDDVIRNDGRTSWKVRPIGGNDAGIMEPME